MLVEHQIRIIELFLKGSCNTDDWSNAPKNSALASEINYILKCTKIENSCFKW